MRYLLHPTDLSCEGEAAFRHAVRLALTVGARLDVLHIHSLIHAAGARTRPELPSPVELAKSWGNDDADAVAAFRQVTRLGDDPAAAIIEQMERRQPDLIVIATERRRGFARWRKSEVAQKIATHSCDGTLFVPYDVRGFVDAETGELCLGRVLVPLDRRPCAQVGLDRISIILGRWVEGPLELVLFHSGGAIDLGDLELPEREDWTFSQRTANSGSVETILEVAAELDCDLIAMPTEGRNGVLDVVWGSTTERVLQGSNCPVLGVLAQAER